MSWLEDAAEWVQDTVDDVVDTVVGAVEDAIETVGDFFEDAAEWVQDGIEDIAGFVADVATKVWDWISEMGSSVWDWIKKAAGDVWEWTTGALEDAWDWVRDAAGDAWDWISSAAETVWDGIVAAAEAVAKFVEEQVVPFLLDVLWVLTHIDDFIIAGFLGLICLLTGQDEKEYDVIEGMFMLDEEALGDRRVAFLPVDGKYVIFSDHHLFIAGDRLDKFRQLVNDELYQVVLASYSKAGYALIENGDVEDLWMKQITLGGAIREGVTDLLGFPFGDMIGDAYEDSRIRTQAVKIFDNNADVYQTIRALFYDRGRYVRLLGNHDDYWRKSSYLPALQFVYPGLKIFDYAFLGNYGPDRHKHGGNSPEVIVAHGHQIDAWNNSVCRAAGAAMTEVASGIPYFATGRDVVKRSKWETKLKGLGFDNRLSGNILGIDEIEFYETVEAAFSNHPYVPQFILGHTHHALEDPWNPDWTSPREWTFDEYSNDGTAGRWEQFIWCVTVENGKVALHGWTWGSDGKPFRYTLAGGYADYLRAI